MIQVAFNKSFFNLIKQKNNWNLAFINNYYDNDNDYNDNNNDNNKNNDDDNDNINNNDNNNN